jgi:hypothetical protein
MDDPKIVIKDEEDNVIQIGDTCVYGDPEQDDLANYNCVVTEISDIDGDADDEGRSFMINPRVTVKFDNGDEDTLATYTESHYPDEIIFVVSDLVFQSR